MLILKPIAHETIWGGRSLQKFFPEHRGKIGHMYSLFDDQTSNLILNGEYRGKNFHEYFAANRDRFGLSKFEKFPLVLAIVEADENLSLQVHPDDQIASEIENSPHGKNESWYFLRPPTSGKIFCGSKISSKSEIQKLIDQNRAAEIFDSLEIHAGDYVFVESGTPHAITSGSMVYEIEENAEFTYRFYDFDRVDSNGNKRQLHIENAMKSVKPELKSIVKKYSGDEIIERMYSTKLLENLNSYRNDSSTLECLTVIDETADEIFENARIRFGSTIVLEPGEEIHFSIGQTILSRPIVEV